MVGLEDELEVRLRGHVEFLAGILGERNSQNYVCLEQARAYIEKSFAQSGYGLEHDMYLFQGKEFRNVVASVPGKSSSGPILVVGAHYDSAVGSPGADDNASGVGVLLELARLLKHNPAVATIRWVAFTLEESPHFRTNSMGSRIHARLCRQRGDLIRGMISLEMVGYFSNWPGSQTHPFRFLRWFYPNKGNFIAVVGNYRSRGLVRTLSGHLLGHCQLPVEQIALPFVPGIGLSDNWSFWKEGYRAVMVTDTAFFRNPNYHQITDQPETLNYESMALLVRGLARALECL